MKPIFHFLQDRFRSVISTFSSQTNLTHLSVWTPESTGKEMMHKCHVLADHFNYKVLNGNIEYLPSDVKQQSSTAALNHKKKRPTTKHINNIFFFDSIWNVLTNTQQCNTMHF